MVTSVDQRQRELLKDINKRMPKNEQVSMEQFIKKPQWQLINERLKDEVKDEYNLSNIFNELEQVSVYMNYNMVKQELVFEPLHKFLLDFVNENRGYFDRLKSNDVPYINLTKLYDDWKMISDNKGAQK